jgi:hypothetical protein
VIALTLGPSFGRPAHRPPRSDSDERKLQYAIRCERALEEQYIAQSISPRKARSRAIEESAARNKISKDLLRDQSLRPKYADLEPLKPEEL